MRTFPVPRRFVSVFGPALALMVMTSVAVEAQPIQQTVRVFVAPDRPSWQYTAGEKADFIISAFQFGNPLDGVTVKYEIMPEKMKPLKTGTTILKNGMAKIEGGTMNTPGFLQCTASVTIDGREYRGVGAAGFDPLKIQPVTDMPSDFREFWEKNKAELARIPIDAKMTLLPEKSTGAAKVYEVSLQNVGGSRVYGILSMPVKPGKYPAMLRVPGAGVRPYNGDPVTAAKGIIHLEIGIHGIPVTMPQSVYNDLGTGALNGYPTFNLDNRDTYYYRRVFLGCIRAVDFLYSLPEFDGERLAVTGSSQGGLLTFVTAGLDKRVKWIGVYCPAYCDVLGYTKDRAGGWPHMFQSLAGQTPERMNTAKYYDAVNFARLVTAPGYYSWGYIDATCPPTSMYAAYNVVNAPKELYLVLDSGHWNYAEQGERIGSWLVDKLLNAK